MEKDLSLELDDIMNEGNVTGVVCCDTNGLMLAVRGVGSSDHAGSVSMIASQASKIFPENTDSPIICLESDKSNLLIRRQDKVVVGIFKNKV